MMRIGKPSTHKKKDNYDHQSLGELDFYYVLNDDKKSQQKEDEKKNHNQK
jgi:hypothetical protein